MTAPTLAVFARADNGHLSCIRDRLRPVRRLIVEELDQVPASLPAIPTDGLTLDLVGHSHSGLLRFHTTVIDQSQHLVELFGRLENAGVTQIRLLGCKTAGNSAARQVVTDLNYALKSPIVRGSVREILCDDFGVEGLRPTALADVFGLPPDANAVDPAFALLALLDENPRPPVAGERRIDRGELARLLPHLAPDPRTCCLDPPGEPPIARTLKHVAIAVGGSVGRGRLVERTDRGLLVLAELASSPPAGPPVEVSYRVDPQHAATVRAIIADWP